MPGMWAGICGQKGVSARLQMSLERICNLSRLLALV